MATNNSSIKNQFEVKFLELQLMGLEQYAKYLNQQLKLSNKQDNWAAYKNYTEKEIVRNDKAILKVKDKLKLS
jgi:hypothetical protein